MIVGTATVQNFKVSLQPVDVFRCLWTAVFEVGNVFIEVQ